MICDLGVDMKKSRMSTLCYIEREEKYLMLHRIVKENDINKNKWIGVGGHFEHGESPEECLVREVKEETGFDLSTHGNYKFRGLVTFVYGETGKEVVEYMHLFTANGTIGEPIDCNEGVLEWIDKKKVNELEIWEGDKIFLRLLQERENFFSLKLVYDINDSLINVILDGNKYIV